MHQHRTVFDMRNKWIHRRSAAVILSLVMILTSVMPSWAFGNETDIPAGAEQNGQQAEQQEEGSLTEQESSTQQKPSLPETDKEQQSTVEKDNAAQPEDKPASEPAKTEGQKKTVRKSGSGEEKAGSDTLGMSVTVIDKGEFASSADGRPVSDLPVKVRDYDGDGDLTVDDALKAAHERYSSMGLAGYRSENGQYGLMITRLWGTDDPVCGYYLNNSACGSLKDKVKENDHIKAFIYKDSSSYSDVYTYFSSKEYTAHTGAEKELTLMSSVYDENYKPAEEPYAGASIKVSGRSEVYTTDSNGKVKISFDKEGTYTVKAYKEDGSIVPSTCRVKVTELRASVFVTIAEKGKIALDKNGRSMADVKVEVTDYDRDGKLTVDDTFRAVHEKHCIEGPAGYQTSSGWMTRFWGDSSGAFGYYLNDSMCMGLTDPVSENDSLKAYIYKDQSGWSDAYTFFTDREYQGTAGDDIELTLMQTGFDASFNTVEKPCAGAVITVQGESTKYETDSSGKVKLSFSREGIYTVKAYKEDGSIVPSICTVRVKELKASVFVTIAEKGKIALDKNGQSMADVKVEVTDYDRNGKLTVDDTFRAVHEKHCIEGPAGYQVSGGWMTRFWGDSSGAFGYYLNDSMCMGLTDPVRENDRLKAYIYKDQSGWSDAYTFFTGREYEGMAGQEIELTLMQTGFDASFNTVQKPCAGAAVTVQGQSVKHVTDSSGKVKLTFEKEGTYTVKAYKEDGSIVPSICTVKVTELKAPVFMTIAEKGRLALDKNGLSMADVNVIVRDYDKDGKLTVDEAFRAVHEEHCSEGPAGYQVSGGWMTRFWGDSSGAFGYYLNDSLCMGLSDTVRAGDRLKAYIYKDQSGWSDAYTYFTSREYKGRSGEDIELTLMQSGFDDSFNTVQKPCEGASIRISGSTDRLYTTDKDGKVLLNFDKDGTYTVQAFREDGSIVPSICTVVINGEAVQNEQVREVIRLIRELPEPEKLTLADKAQVDAAKAAFDRLSADDQAQVPFTYREKLDAAVKKIKELQKEAAPESFEKAYKETGNLISGIASDKAGFGAEWSVLGLARAGKLDSKTKERYYNSLVSELKKNGSAKLGAYSTDNARTVLALTAMGYDPRDVAGYDLLEPLADFGYVSSQGVNGPVFALIAFDSHGYSIPAVAGRNVTTREKLKDSILSSQRKDGGWAARSTDKASDPDMTAMAVQALAPYADSDPAVRAAVDKAVQLLSDIQESDGAYRGNSLSCSQVIVALTSAGIDPSSDKRFIKNGSSVVDGLLAFYVKNGGFSINSKDTSFSGMATDQGYYAMAAYDRFIRGKTSLYDMSDIKLAAGGHGNGEAEHGASAPSGSKPAGHTAALGALASTRSVSIKLTGKLSAEAAAVIDMIAALDLGGDGRYTEKQIEDITEAYRAYSRLPEADKLMVKADPAYRGFPDALRRTGRQYHYDRPSGIDMRDNAEKILPWYVRLQVTPCELTDGQQKDVEKAAGKNSRVLSMFDIAFVNTLDGSEWNPEDPVKVKIPAPDAEGYRNTVIVHISDSGDVSLIEGKPDDKDGTVVFETSDFSLYGVAGTDQQIRELMETHEESSIWPWIAAAAAAAVILVIIAAARHAYIRKNSNSR